jgi:hypothetical protein
MLLTIARYRSNLVQMQARGICQREGLAAIALTVLDNELRERDTPHDHAVQSEMIQVLVQYTLIFSPSTAEHKPQPPQRLSR